MLQFFLAVHSRLPGWQNSLPGWLQSPVWWRHASYSFWHFVYGHQAAGLFGAIFAEELGIPLPAPGDVIIAWGGYLTTTGAIPYIQAYLAVIGGAVLGSTVLFTLSRHYGHPFLVRYGRFIGLDHERLERVERAFRRWGPWAIIVGRHIPGMRIYLSAFAGAFEVPYRVFIPSVLVSSTIWAALFLELGRRLGPQSRFLFRLLPAHLLPLLLILVAALAFGVVAWERGWRPRRPRRPPRTSTGPANSAPEAVNRAATRS